MRELSFFRFSKRKFKAGKRPTLPFLAEAEPIAVKGQVVERRERVRDISWDEGGERVAVSLCFIPVDDTCVAQARGFRQVDRFGPPTVGIARSILRMDAKPVRRPWSRDPARTEFGEDGTARRCGSSERNVRGEDPGACAARARRTVVEKKGSAERARHQAICQGVPRGGSGRDGAREALRRVPAEMMKACGTFPLRHGVSIRRADVTTDTRAASSARSTRASCGGCLEILSAETGRPRSGHAGNATERAAPQRASRREAASVAARRDFHLQHAEQLGRLHARHRACRERPAWR